MKYYLLLKISFPFFWMGFAKPILIVPNNNGRIQQPRILWGDVRTESEARPLHQYNNNNTFSSTIQAKSYYGRKTRRKSKIVENGQKGANEVRLGYIRQDVDLRSSAHFSEISDEPNYLLNYCVFPPSFLCFTVFHFETRRIY